MNQSPLLWILQGRKPIPTSDHKVWAEFLMDIEKRRVAHTTIEQPESDPVVVSTVFVGIDVGLSHRTAPLLFESMVFGGPLDGDTYRHCTWDEAEAGHKMLIDEAVVEGKVAAWEVRARLRALSKQAGGQADGTD